MPWLDPARHESDDDQMLRAELQGLLGMPEAPLLAGEPTPELNALADSLRQEAERRRRVVPLRRPSRLLLAAGLPFALAAVGLGAWGFAQKHRADTLARDLEAQRQNHEAQLVAVRQELSRVQEDAQIQPALQTARKTIRPADPKGKELVIPADKAALPGLQGAVTVKDRR
ncbi:MAG: hypothetical protein BWY56_00759 [Acidobacteria bacterium ADurb.Bin340]|mgnify:FL=1|nr:MAG: hypothetical protein BWY56_00759 [Acidobacteria bacterium ADurb.Bin340]HOD33800.1 hypothetical protein [Holophaga sp.]HQL49225.1 hypothetical protein [Holophaga sp.]